MADPVYPELSEAQGLGFCPSPAKDGGAPARQRVMSAEKYMQLCDEIMALNRGVFIPIYNATGATIPVGPVTITGWHTDTAYLVNGAVLQGLSTIQVDTGANPIKIGNLFTLAGVLSNPGGDLQVFISTVNLTGAGALSFTPPLPNDVADNAVMTLNQGFTVAPATAGLQVHAFIANTSGDLPDKGWDIGWRLGVFTAALLDASGAAVGDPVYVDPATGLPTLALPSVALYPDQIIGRVMTATNPALVMGMIVPPVSVGTSQIGAGAVLNANVGAAAAIAGTKISPDFGAQNVKTTGTVGVGGSPDASAKLDVQSTTSGLGVASMTTTQKNAIAAPREGLLVYDSTLHKLSIRTVATWETVTSV